MNRLRYLLGLVTLALAITGGVFLYELLTDTDSRNRFHLDLEFRDVRGLKPGADVRHRGVLVGTVHHLRLRDDGKRGIVTITLDPTARDFARYNSRFWIVTPRFQGLTGGASGLDTLVRDSYVAFVSPEPQGPPLPDGSSIPGSEEPEPDPESLLPAISRGDLVMTLLVPENYGLNPGSRIMYRGVRTGEVRDVKLASNGTHVELILRIERDHRRTITDSTKFWVARPRLSGALLSGISIDDLSALLTPFVGYYTAPDGALPVADGYRAAATVERPDFSLSQVPVRPNGEGPVTEARPPQAEPIHVVRVFYAAKEVDWLSADDDITREGAGVLFEDGSGGLVVLTCRSICDGIWFVSDGWFSKPKMRDERLRVLLADGTVVHAGRSWVDEAADLAVLKIQDAPHGIAATPARLLQIGDGSSGGAAVTPPAAGAPASSSPSAGTAAPSGTVASTDASRKTILQQRKADGAVATRAFTPGPDLSLDEWRGAAVIAGDKLIGILGQRGKDDAQPTVLGLSRLPESLRPKQ